MKKILLTDKKGFYKANLHCHSVISDGAKTPEELKEMYMKRGYSIIAYTDHDVLLPHNDLSDDKFLALNGYEMEIEEENVNPVYLKACHLCYIALSPDNLKQVCYHRTKYLYVNSPKYRHLIQYDTAKADFERKYSPECINEMIKEGRDNGFFVTYNHPQWSLESLDEYGKYHGMNAMEICNYSSVREGFDDYNEKEYDDILRRGERVFCVAGDDNHNETVPDTSDSFGAFTVINSEKLEYCPVTDSLVNGNFYASQGPEIYELWYEDGKIGIRCSECKSIILRTGSRRCGTLYSDEGQSVTSAVFDVCDTDIYVRITITDDSGKHANTNAYFVDEL